MGPELQNSAQRRSRPFDSHIPLNVPTSTITAAVRLIDKLSANNYAVWQARMKALLVSKGSWKVSNPVLEDSGTDSTKIEEALP